MFVGVFVDKYGTFRPFAFNNRLVSETCARDELSLVKRFCAVQGIQGVDKKIRFVQTKARDLFLANQIMAMLSYE